MSIARAERLLNKISIFELRRRVEKLRAADFVSLSAEAVKFRMGRIIDQYPFQIRPLMLKGVYRARVNPPGHVFTRAAELWYPPATAVTRPSRLNRPGQVLFYAASMANTAGLELRAKIGDAITVLLACTRSGSVERLNVSFLGLERAKAPEVSSLKPDDMFRHASHFKRALGLGNYKKWLLIDDYLSEIFATPVPDGHEYLYKPAIALGEWLFTAPKLDAVNYPSVATGDHGVNICMRPARADALFEPLEAWMLELQESGLHPDTREPLTRIGFIRRSHAIGTDGVIRWREPGEGMGEQEILSFTRHRMLGLKRWPLPPGAK